MKTFKDSKERVWTIAINNGSINRARDLVKVDLYKAVEGKIIGELLEDTELLINLIYALCKPEAEAKGVSDVQFGEGLVGDPIDDATTALLEDLIGFFPKARRGLLEKALQKIQAIEKMAVAKAHERLDSPELEQQLQAIVAGGTPTNGQASPA